MCFPSYFFVGHTDNGCFRRRLRTLILCLQRKLGEKIEKKEGNDKETNRKREKRGLFSFEATEKV